MEETSLLSHGILTLVCWCFKHNQPQRIISGLKETFTKRYIAEMTNKAEMRPVEPNEKAESCRDNSWNEIQLKGPYDRNRHENRIKRSEQARFVYIKKPTSDYNDSEVDKLQNVIDQTTKDILLVQEDWNAKVGNDANGNLQGICRPFYNDKQM